MPPPVSTGFAIGGAGRRAGEGGRRRPGSPRMQPFIKHDLICSRFESVPFWGNSATVAPPTARRSAVIKQESETMPSTEIGTVRIASERQAGRRPALRVVGEPAAPPRRQRNAERRPREYLTPAEVETLIATARKRGRYS